MLQNKSEERNVNKSNLKTIHICFGLSSRGGRTKGTSSFGKRGNDTQVMPLPWLCHPFGSLPVAGVATLPRGRESITTAPRLKDETTTGTGRMRHLKIAQGKVGHGFREGTNRSPRGQLSGHPLHLTDSNGQPHSKYCSVLKIHIILHMVPTLQRSLWGPKVTLKRNWGSDPQLSWVKFSH